MNTKEIEAVVTVYKCRGFYETAYTLNYSTSMISKYISNVEAELGVTLFVRGNRASSVSLTKEGEILIPRFVSMYESYRQLVTEAKVLQSAGENHIRIGTGIQLSSLGINEIMADFLQKNPAIHVEQVKYDMESLIHFLYSRQLDGAFILVIEGSQNERTLKNVLDDPKIEAYILLHDCTMYLGISEKEPLARQDEAPLAAFRDFSIAFHSNREIIIKAATMEPFKRLSEKSGFELKPLFIEPRDESVFYLATQMKIAVPTLSCSFKYPSIKFVRVSDWESYTTTYFLSLKTNESRALAQFKKVVKAHLQNT
jgi:DNA-binding transcriptional LysR family regulator